MSAAAEAVRRRLTELGVTVSIGSRPDLLALEPATDLTPELLDEVRAVKADLLWGLHAEQALADLFERVAIAWAELPAPRPEVDSPAWWSALDQVEAAYRSMDQESFPLALRAAEAEAARICAGGVVAYCHAQGWALRSTDQGGVTRLAAVDADGLPVRSEAMRRPLSAWPALLQAVRRASK